MYTSNDCKTHPHKFNLDSPDLKLKWLNGQTASAQLQLVTTQPKHRKTDADISTLLLPPSHTRVRPVVWLWAHPAA